MENERSLYLTRTLVCNQSVDAALLDYRPSPEENEPYPTIRIPTAVCRALLMEDLNQNGSKVATRITEFLDSLNCEIEELIFSLWPSTTAKERDMYVGIALQYPTARLRLYVAMCRGSTSGNLVKRLVLVVAVALQMISQVRLVLYPVLRRLLRLSTY